MMFIVAEAMRLQLIFARSEYLDVPSLPALGPWATPAERGPSLESIYQVSLTVDFLQILRQKISSIYCTVICNYPSAAQEQPFTVGLFCITKTVNRY